MIKQKKSLYFGLFPALIFQVIGAYLYFEVWPLQTLGKVIYFATKLLLLVWPLIWWKCLKTPLTIRPKKVLHTLVLGLSSGLLLSLGLILIFQFLPNKELLTLQIQDKAEAYLHLNLQLYLLFSLFLSLAHSLLEEYYWRWFTAKGLAQYFSTRSATLTANLAFAAHHFIILYSFVDFTWAVFGTFAVFIGGMLWSVLEQKTNSLFASWISHALVDATIMGIGYLLLF